MNNALLRGLVSYVSILTFPSSAIVTFLSSIITIDTGLSKTKQVKIILSIISLVKYQNFLFKSLSKNIEMKIKCLI
jgi:hypothetical protein